MLISLHTKECFRSKRQEARDKKLSFGFMKEVWRNLSPNPIGVEIGFYSILPAATACMVLIVNPNPT
jgi:hypothetical protein